MNKTLTFKFGIRPFWGWAFAIAGSILLNISLFGLMPGLIQRLPAAPDELEEIKHLQVIRVKKMDSPPRRKKPPKSVKPKPITKIKHTPISPLKKAPMPLKPRLAFEINPKLPAAHMDLVMPALENFSMLVPNLKALYDIGELDAGLIPLVKIPPMYPIRAKRRNIEGFVTIEFKVTKKGGVIDIEVIRAQPDKIFNKSVLSCVSQWKFKPGTVEGIPVATRARTTIHFKLED